MSFTKDHLRRIAQIAHARGLNFVELVGLAELDPATAFRGATLRGNMRGQDLSGFNFIGATLAPTCDLSDADLTYIEGVTPEMLAAAKTNANTKLPRVWFWETGKAPSWAEDWGRDAYGPWVIFRVPGTDITQRLRWSPPGVFMMGSANDERSSSGAERPRHRVAFAQGFWMFETACTRQLWLAVTGKEPGDSQGVDIPVTRVSWTDANDFADRLNDMLPGLSLGLPSEAQWEYACRAGTVTPYSFGVRITKKQVCYDSGRPAAVGSLPANPRGFHEMHGNVWEWCEDTWHVSYEGAPADGSAWKAGGSAYRVLRGGSWGGDARGVRSASRFHFVPSDRNYYFGFRCARVQNSGQRSGGEVAAPADPTGAESAERRKREGAVGDDTAPKRRNAPRAWVPEKPSWAEKADRDQYGEYAILAVPTGRGRVVRQRLRLIQSGSFRMGSPEQEPGRFDDEGPVHDVSVHQRFWLFDTPCTQQLWRAVMGKNPSAFKSPTRPVETVSFNDVIRFLERVNDRVNDLNLTLPSEAQWEYACRAGSQEASYVGPIEILGDNNAPILDSIAWYSGNSGHQFDLSKGWDSSGWKDQQYEHTKAGTRKVKQKQPNKWGLHDMLGNVWEWCEDNWHDTYEGAPGDGSAWKAAGSADRVLRGGSWGNVARDVRSASRTRIVPSDRGSNFGFRCARVQNSD